MPVKSKTKPKPRVTFDQIVPSSFSANNRQDRRLSGGMSDADVAHMARQIDIDRARLAGMSIKNSLAGDLTQEIRLNSARRYLELIRDQEQLLEGLWPQAHADLEAFLVINQKKGGADFLALADGTISALGYIGTEEIERPPDEEVTEAKYEVRPAKKLIDRVFGKVDVIEVK